VGTAGCLTTAGAGSRPRKRRQGRRPMLKGKYGGGPAAATIETAAAQPHVMRAGTPSVARRRVRRSPRSHGKNLGFTPLRSELQRVGGVGGSAAVCDSANCRITSGGADGRSRVRAAGLVLALMALAKAAHSHSI
jgi:hypothetical protein